MAADLIEFQPVDSLTLTIGRAPAAIPRSVALKVGSLWDQRTLEQPTLWDGQILSVDKLHWDGGGLTMTLRETRYSHYVASNVLSLQEPFAARILFSSAVILTSDNRVVLVRMADETATPGRIQLPGGNVELSDIRSNGAETFVASARREAREELGWFPLQEYGSRLYVVQPSPNSVGVAVPFCTPVDSSELTAVFRKGLRDTEIYDVEFARFTHGVPGAMVGVATNDPHPYMTALLSSLPKMFD